jgi:Fur family ferric uptake transcriptional regulator
MSCEEVIFRRLRERGFRLTPQREMVLSVMHEKDDFATAEQIFEGVRTRSSSVDISTVYRTLDLLQDFHVVAVVDLGDGQRRYRLSDLKGPRVHLFCRSCGTVVGLDVGLMRSFTAHLKGHRNFEADMDGLTIPGLCKMCQTACEEAATG